MKLIDQTPITCKLYPIPHAPGEKVEKDTESMIRMGAVTRMKSGHAFPLVALLQKVGMLRNCVQQRIRDAEETFSQPS